MRKIQRRNKFGRNTVGLRDIYFAKLIKDDATGVAYETPVKIGKAIEASVSPNTNSETLNADDGPSEIETAFGGTEIEIGVDQLAHDVQALLLGHSVNADGVLEKKATDEAPYGALLFRAQVSGGGYKLYAFYKGKFQPQEESFATKTDSLNSRQILSPEHSCVVSSTRFGADLYVRKVKALARQLSIIGSKRCMNLLLLHLLRKRIQGLNRFNGEFGASRLSFYLIH